MADNNTASELHRVCGLIVWWYSFKAHLTTLQCLIKSIIHGCSLAHQAIAQIAFTHDAAAQAHLAIIEYGRLAGCGCGVGVGEVQG